MLRIKTKPLSTASAASTTILPAVSTTTAVSSSIHSSLISSTTITASPEISALASPAVAPNTGTKIKRKASAVRASAPSGGVKASQYKSKKPKTTAVRKEDDSENEESLNSAPKSIAQLSIPWSDGKTISVNLYHYNSQDAVQANELIPRLNPDFPSWDNATQRSFIGRHVALIKKQVPGALVFADGVQKNYIILAKLALLASETPSSEIILLLKTLFNVYSPPTSSTAATISAPKKTKTDAHSKSQKNTVPKGGVITKILYTISLDVAGLSPIKLNVFGLDGDEMVSSKELFEIIIDKSKSPDSQVREISRKVKTCKDLNIDNLLITATLTTDLKKTLGYKSKSNQSITYLILKSLVGVELKKPRLKTSLPFYNIMAALIKAIPPHIMTKALSEKNQNAVITTSLAPKTATTKKAKKTAESNIITSYNAKIYSISVPERPPIQFRIYHFKKLKLISSKELFTSLHNPFKCIEICKTSLGIPESVFIPAYLSAEVRESLKLERNQEIQYLDIEKLRAVVLREGRKSPTRSIMEALIKSPIFIELSTPSTAATSSSMTSNNTPDTAQEISTSLTSKDDYTANSSETYSVVVSNNTSSSAPNIDGEASMISGQSQENTTPQTIPPMCDPLPELFPSSPWPIQHQARALNLYGFFSSSIIRTNPFPDVLNLDGNESQSGNNLEG